MKKSFFIWILSCASLLATPDWEDNTNETFLGSNDKFYATFLTEKNNQGSYYEWREIKRLNEYSKEDGSIINTTIISDILYSKDANHNDPNTSPKITKSVQKHNKDVFLASLFTEYHLPLLGSEKPEWISRLSWSDGNIVLDQQLTLVSNDTLTGLKIPLEFISEEPVTEIISQVHSDRNSIYLVIQIETDNDDNTHVINLSENITKQLRDRINILDEYVLIKSFKTFQEANTFGLELIEEAQTKNFFGFNPQIWLSRVTEKDAMPYSVLHRPLDLPIDPEQIKRLDAVIGINTSTIKSELFIEKWIPYDPNVKPPTDEEEDMPEEHIDE